MPKSILSVLADNPAVMQELEKVLLEEFALDGLSTDKTDEELGQDTRAYLVGKTRIRAALKKIAGLQTIQPQQSIKNPGR